VCHLSFSYSYTPSKEVLSSWQLTKEHSSSMSSFLRALVILFGTCLCILVIHLCKYGYGLCMTLMSAKSIIQGQSQTPLQSWLRFNQNPNYSDHLGDIIIFTNFQHKNFKKQHKFHSEVRCRDTQVQMDSCLQIWNIYMNYLTAWSWCECV
jgi:hypothetical protein